MISDVSEDFDDLVPPSQRIWQYNANPQLLLSDLKPSKPQKTLQPLVDLSTGQVIGLEEVRLNGRYLSKFFMK
jgi:hypothetical protein